MLQLVTAGIALARRAKLRKRNAQMAFKIVEGEPHPLLTPAEHQPRRLARLPPVSHQRRQAVHRNDLAPHPRVPQPFRHAPGNRLDFSAPRQRGNLAHTDGVRLTPQPYGQQALHLLRLPGSKRQRARPVERLAQLSGSAAAAARGRLAHVPPSQARSSARQNSASASRLKPPPNSSIREASSRPSSASARFSSRRAVSTSLDRFATSPRCRWGIANDSSR